MSAAAALAVDTWAGAGVGFGSGGAGSGGTSLTIFFRVEVEFDAADVAHGGVESAQDQFSAPQFDSAAIRPLTTSMRATWMASSFSSRAKWRRESGTLTVRRAELLSAESSGAATDSGDLDVGAILDSGLNWHVGPGGLSQIFPYF
jgi:hypothetical protein